MFRFLKATLVLTAVLPAGMAAAATSIDLQGSDNGQKIHNKILVNNNWVRISILDQQESTDVLFDTIHQIIYVLDHKDRSFMEMTEQGMEQMGTQLQGVMTQIQSQLSQVTANMSEQDKAQMGNFLQNMGLGQPAEAPAPVVAEFHDTGTSQIVSGINCSVGQIIENGQPKGQACIAQKSTLGIPDADYTALRKLAEFGGRMATKMASLFNTGESMPSFDLSTVSGLPIEIKHGATHVAVTSINQQDTAPIAVPEGYTKRINPLLGQ